MTTASEPLTEYRSWAVEEFRAETEPYYVPVSDEVELFRAAWEAKIPVLLKGPTGCGKTRFVEHMAFHLNRPVQGKDGIEVEDLFKLVLGPQVEVRVVHVQRLRTVAGTPVALLRQKF